MRLDCEVRPLFSNRRQQTRAEIWAYIDSATIPNPTATSVVAISRVRMEKRFDQ